MDNNMDTTPLDLTEFGYKKSAAPNTREYASETLWYKVFRDCDHLCSTNDRLQYTVKDAIFDFPEAEYRSISIRLNHADSEDTWYDLSIYSLTAEELSNNIGKFERKLLAAWVAVNETK